MSGSSFGIGGGRNQSSGDTWSTGENYAQSNSGGQSSGYNVGQSQGSSGGYNQGSSYGGSQGSSVGISQGDSLGMTQGSSFGQSGSTADVWGAQQPALENLYSQAAMLANGTSAAGQGAQGVAGQAQNAWLSQLTPGGNPYFERSVQGAIDQATKGFTEGVLPELDARGVGVGQYGGARDNLARGQAAGTFGEGLANQVAGMYSQQYQGDQQRALGALGLAGNVQGLYTQPLQTASGIVGGPTVLQQSQATSGAQNTGYNTATNDSYSQAQNTAFNQAQNSGSNWAQNTANNYGGNQASNWANSLAAGWNDSAGTQHGSGWNANTSAGGK